MRIERATDDVMLAAIYRLRVEAWRARVDDFPAIERWTDGYDVEAMHWAGFDGDVLIAAARLTVHDHVGEAPDADVYRAVFPEGLPEPFGVFSRLCVAPGHGGRGLSARLDEVRLDFARRLGCSCVVAVTTSGRSRISTMQQSGFRQVVDQIGQKLSVMGHSIHRTNSIMLKPLWEDGFAAGPCRDAAIRPAGGVG